MLLRTTEVTDLLNITPATLRLWTERYSFPTAVRGEDHRLRFDAFEVHALQRELSMSHSVPMAISAARTAPTRMRLAA